MNQNLGIKEPCSMGSYLPEDAIFLLKDIGKLVQEQSNEVREKAIQSGVHYSEMLPIEYKPSPAYVNLFHTSLNESAEKVGIAVGVVATQIFESRGEQVVLASLARAGTPVGVLIKRYLQQRFGVNIPHYSMSIIRGKGIDENAIRYIQKTHPHANIQFVDGWTGKGAITHVLQNACEAYNNQYGSQNLLTNELKENSTFDMPLNSDLAVLADPGFCAHLFGTREDFLIPSACLNSTVSGLVSRTVLRPDLIGSDDFHGARYYSELASEDLSYVFIDTIAQYFGQPEFEGKVEAQLQARAKVVARSPIEAKPTWQGMKDIERIQSHFGMDDINHVKPGIGETTRVLLRRVPWKILVKDPLNPNLKHILLLAAERNVPIEVYKDMAYNCCGLIKSLGGDM